MKADRLTSTSLAPHFNIQSQLDAYHPPSRLPATGEDRARQENTDDQPQMPAWLLITSTLTIVAFVIGMIWGFLTIKPWN